MLGSREKSKNLYLPNYLVPHLLEERCPSSELKFRAGMLGHSNTEWGFKEVTQTWAWPFYGWSLLL